MQQTETVAQSSTVGPVRRLYAWVLHWADTPHAVAALALLAFAESSFFPIPPDVLLIAMCLGKSRRALWFAGVCTVASVVGGMFGYGIGYLAWQEARPLFFAHVPGFNAASFGRVQAAYEQWGVVIVFTAGFSPIPYKLFTVVSGAMELSFLPFVGASIISRGARFLLVAALIRRYGTPIRGFIDRYFNTLALAFTVLLVGGFVALKWLL